MASGLIESFRVWKKIDWLCGPKYASWCGVGSHVPHVRFAHRRLKFNRVELNPNVDVDSPVSFELGDL